MKCGHIDKRTDKNKVWNSYLDVRTFKYLIMNMSLKFQSEKDSIAKFGNKCIKRTHTDLCLSNAHLELTLDIACRHTPNALLI